MARLYATGAELNSASSGIDVTTISGTASISSSTYRSGSYAYRFNPTASNGYGVATVFNSNQTTTIYVSMWFRIDTLPGSSTRIIDLRNSSDTTVGHIDITTGGALQLYKADGTQIGSDSSTLSTGTWYNIQMSSDASASPGTLTGRLSGSSFASGSNSSQGQWSQVRFGAAHTGSVTTDLYVDDLIINNSTGSFCNTFASTAEKVIVIRPDSDGDNSAWAGTYADVDEVTPNDATDYISSTTANQIEEHNYGASGLGSTDTITAVSVNSREYGPSSFSNTPTGQSRLKASSGGTVETGTSIQPGSVWGTNLTGSSTGIQHLLTTYDLPGASTTAWTYSDVDALQAGFQITVDRLGDLRVTAIWVTVTYIPATDLSINVSDTITITESINRTLESNVNKSDSITVSESVNSTLVHNVNKSDSITVTESKQLMLESYINVNDSITITESTGVFVTPLYVNVSDNITISESVNRLLESNVVTSDTITVSEALQRLLESYVNKSDSITITESLKELLESYINKSDTITTTENSQVFVTPLYVNVSDTITITDSPNVSIPVLGALSISTAENIAITESLELALTPLYANVSDAITVTEDWQRMLESYVNKSDTITTTESVNVNLNATTTPTINVSDTITASESTTVFVTPLRVNVSDTITIAEGLTVSPPGLATNIQYPNIFTMEIADPIGKVIVGQGLTAYSNGTPVGTPNGYAMCFDYANDKLYIYNYNSSTWIAIN